MQLSFTHGFDQRQAFAAPVADAGDDDLRQRAVHRRARRPSRRPAETVYRG